MPDVTEYCSKLLRQLPCASQSETAQDLVAWRQLEERLWHWSKSCKAQLMLAMQTGPSLRFTMQGFLIIRG